MVKQHRLESPDSVSGVEMSCSVCGFTRMLMGLLLPGTRGYVDLEEKQMPWNK